MKKINLLLATFFTLVLLLTSCKKEEFVVTFHPNGGKGDIVAQHFTQKVAQQLMGNTFTKKGYVFFGWNTVPDGAGTKYEDEEKIVVSDNMVLYAQWVEVTGTVTVTFSANGGVGEMAVQEFEAGEPKAIAPNAFYKDDYSFTGWNTNPNGTGTAYENQQIITITSNRTLYAQWKPKLNSYFVIFDANGGEGKMESQEFIQSKYQKLSSCQFTYSNYFFNGWNTLSDGSGTFYRNKEEIMIYANMLLYAQWVEVTGGGVPCPNTPTVVDNEGNTYTTVQIGPQCWMGENLRTTKFKTGSNIEIVEDQSKWFLSETAAMCFYDNDDTYSLLYGALYNGFAANSSNLCPDGWHIPLETEWNTLANFLDGAAIAGYKMKSIYDWSKGWYGENGNGSNESGFNALPAGYRDGLYTGNFADIGNRTVFWSAPNGFSESEARILEAGSLELKTSYFGNIFGLSVRCIKD